MLEQVRYDVGDEVYFLGAYDKEYSYGKICEILICEYKITYEVRGGGKAHQVHNGYFITKSKDEALLEVHNRYIEKSKKAIREQASILKKHRQKAKIYKERLLIEELAGIKENEHR